MHTKVQLSHLSFIRSLTAQNASVISEEIYF